MSGKAVKSSKDIPREEIPWFPTIAAEKCTGCGSCAEFCIHGVYEMADKAKVKNPYNCVVGCTGCLTECPEGAIKFPSYAEFLKEIKRVRERYKLKE